MVGKERSFGPSGTAVEFFVDKTRIATELNATREFLLNIASCDGCDSQHDSSSLETSVSALVGIVPHVEVPEVTVVEFHDGLTIHSSSDISKIENLVSSSCNAITPEVWRLFAALTTALLEKLPPVRSDFIREEIVSSVLRTSAKLEACRYRQSGVSTLMRRWQLVAACLPMSDDMMNTLAPGILRHAVDDLTLVGEEREEERTCDVIVYVIVPLLGSHVRADCLADILRHEADRKFSSPVPVPVLRGLASLVETSSPQMRLRMWDNPGFRALVRDALVCRLKECRKLAEYLISVAVPSTWSDYVRFLIALSEPQLHIVSPTVTRVRKYVEFGGAVSFSLHQGRDISWFFVLLERLWLHENAWVVAQGVLMFFAVPSLPPNWDSENNLKFLQGTLLKAIGDSRIFHVADSGGATGLGKALQRFLRIWALDGLRVPELQRAMGFILSQNLGPVQSFLFASALRACSNLKAGYIERDAACKAVALIPERTSGYPSDVRGAILRLWIDQVLSRSEEFDLIVAARLIMRCVSKNDRQMVTGKQKRLLIMEHCLMSSHKSWDVECVIGAAFDKLVEQPAHAFDENDLEVLALIIGAVNGCGLGCCDLYTSQFKRLFKVRPQATCYLLADCAREGGILLDDAEFWNESIGCWFRLLSLSDDEKSVRFFESCINAVFKSKTALDELTPHLEELIQARRLPWKLYSFAAIAADIFPDAVDEVLDVSPLLNDGDLLDSDLWHYLHHLSVRAGRLNGTRDFPLSAYLPRILHAALRSYDVASEDIICGGLSSVRGYLDAFCCCRDGSGEGAAHKLSSILAEEPDHLPADVVVFLLDLWSRVLSKRGHAYFWTHLNLISDIVFHPVFVELSKTDVNVHNCLESIWESCLQAGETVTQLVNVVSKRVAESLAIVGGVASVPFGKAFIVGTILFGPVRRRDLRLLEQLSIFINSRDWPSQNIVLDGWTSLDAEVRLLGLKTVATLVPADPRGVELVEAVGTELVTEFWGQTLRHESGTPLRNFVGTLEHRHQVRIVQFLLCAVPFVGSEEETSRSWLEWTQEVIVGGGVHSSVLYFVEWLAAEILRKNGSIAMEFVSWVVQEAGNRGGPIASMLRIVIFALRSDPGLLLSERRFRETLVQRVISLCMSHNFATRVHAQWCAEEMLRVCRGEGEAGSFSNEERLLLSLATEAANECASLDEAVRKRSGTEFIVDHFNPGLHYSLESIFFDFPRISGIPEDEWLPPDRLPEVASSPAGVVWNLKAPSQALRNRASSTSSVEFTSSVVYSLHEDKHRGNGAKANLQVKHVTSRYCSPSLAQLSELSIPDALIDVRMRSRQSGLIVCATLIDKAPNLGGLCRTCEVLGVDEYVIKSMKLVENPAFKNVSVTAERWLTIREVTEANLKSYLRSMRASGYTIVALEQSAESVPIHEFQFPEKSLLVLGHEKEGIPGQLLNMVDFNVIIPQTGIVRSLNVHVAASVGIWEYVRARNKSRTN